MRVALVSFQPEQGFCEQLERCAASPLSYVLAEALTLRPADEARTITRWLHFSERDLLPFVCFYHALLSNVTAVAALLGTPPEPMQARLVNALAFGCYDLLPKLWR